MADKIATGRADEADLDALLDGAPGLGMCAAGDARHGNLLCDQPPLPLLQRLWKDLATLDSARCLRKHRLPGAALAPPCARSPLCAAHHPECLLVSPQGRGRAIQQPRCALRAATHTRRRRTGSACRQAGPQVRPPAEARQGSPASQRGARTSAASRPGRRCRGGPDCRAVEAAGGAGQRQVALPLLLCGSECLRGVDWLTWYSRTWGRSADPPGAAHTPKALPPPSADRRCLPPPAMQSRGRS